MAETRSILVCEDDPVQLALMSAALGQAGYETVTARSPGEALERVKAKPADAVVADVRLLGGDAFDVLNGMRLAGHRAPMLMLSGHADARTRGKAIEKGASALLEKPVSLRSLVRMVGSMIHRPNAPVPASLKVLIVQSDDPVRRRMAAMVEGAGMRVEAAPGLAAGLKLVQSARVPFDFAVVALREGGAGVIELLLSADPGLYVVTTGAPNGDAARAAYRAGADTLVQEADHLPRLLLGSIAAAARKRVAAERRHGRQLESRTARWVRKVRRWLRPGWRAVGSSIRLQLGVFAASLLAGALLAVSLGWLIREHERAEQELKRSVLQAELLRRAPDAFAPLRTVPPSQPIAPLDPD